MPSSTDQSTAGNRDEVSRYIAPPIVEAVTELRFKDRLNARDFERLVEKLGKRYPTRKQEQIYEIKVELTTALPSVHNVRPSVRLSSHDEADVCLVRDDLIAWSRLSPYEGWEAFESRVTGDLAQGEKLTAHRKVDRIGMRYINRFDVPPEGEMNVVRYEDYLAVHLQLPSILDPNDGYNWRIEKRYLPLGLRAAVQSGLMPPEIPGTAAFSLDIDIMTMVDVANSRDNIVRILRTMRTLKNDIFEQSITPLARKSFS